VLGGGRRCRAGPAARGSRVRLLRRAGLRRRAGRPTRPRGRGRGARGPQSTPDLTLAVRLDDKNYFTPWAEAGPRDRFEDAGCGGRRWHRRCGGRQWHRRRTGGGGDVAAPGKSDEASGDEKSDEASGDRFEDAGSIGGGRGGTWRLLRRVTRRQVASHHRISLMKLRGARRLQLLFAIAWGSLGQENSVTEAPDRTFLGGWSGGVPRGSCTTLGSMRRVICTGQRAHR
jgi:hypothetical protein